MKTKTKHLAIGTPLAAFGTMLLFDGLTSRFGGEGEIFFGVLFLVPAVFFLRKAFSSGTTQDDGDQTD
jgi:hypothetical protein